MSYTSSIPIGDRFLAQSSCAPGPPSSTFLVWLRVARNSRKHYLDSTTNRFVLWCALPFPADSWHLCTRPTYGTSSSVLFSKGSDYLVAGKERANLGISDRIGQLRVDGGVLDVDMTKPIFGKGKISTVAAPASNWLAPRSFRRRNGRLSQ